jgi:hypothetical protein
MQILIFDPKPDLLVSFHQFLFISESSEILTKSEAPATFRLRFTDRLALKLSISKMI